MTPLILFRKAYDDSNDPKYGILQGQTTKPIEKIGPANYEKYAHIALITGSTKEVSTFPHIDIFKTLRDIYTTDSKRDHCNIVLTGETNQYTVNVYGNNITSLSQYFLEHKTRENKIQYLIFVDEEETNPLYRFKAFIPGLLYDSSNGEVLGYLNSHVANKENKITIELPYGSNYSEYIFHEIESGKISRVGNMVTIRDIMTEYNNIIISHGSSSASFKLFPNNSNGGTVNFTVKNVNEFGDYTVAAQLTSNNIKNIINLLSELEEKMIVIPPKESGGTQIVVRDYFPTTFISLLNSTPSEEVANITPNLYNVPAAFVPTDNGIVFMTDVLGISANQILNGAISQ